MTSTSTPPSIEELRAALRLMHAVAIGESDRAYMSIPADPKRDADLLLSAALDELEAWRAADEELSLAMNTICGLAFDFARAQEHVAHNVYCAFCGVEQPRADDAMRKHAARCVAHPMGRLVKAVDRLLSEFDVRCDFTDKVKSANARQPSLEALTALVRARNNALGEWPEPVPSSHGVDRAVSKMETTEGRHG